MRLECLRIYTTLEPKDYVEKTIFKFSRSESKGFRKRRLGVQESRTSDSVVTEESVMFKGIVSFFDLFGRKGKDQ